MHPCESQDCHAHLLSGSLGVAHHWLSKDIWTIFAWSFFIISTRPHLLYILPSASPYLHNPHLPVTAVLPFGTSKVWSCSFIPKNASLPIYSGIQTSSDGLTANWPLKFSFPSFQIFVEYGLFRLHAITWIEKDEWISGSSGLAKSILFWRLNPSTKLYWVFGSLNPEL